MIKYNLQFFAKDGPGGEKTEQPTAKKLKDARKEGQVAKSQEIGNAFAIFGGFLILMFYASSIGNDFMENFSNFYTMIPDVIAQSNNGATAFTIHQIMQMIYKRLISTVLPIFLIMVLIGIVVNLVQVKWLFTTKPLKPSLGKFNPAKGLKKIVSARSLFELLKSIIKIVVVGYVAISTISDKREILLRIYDIPLILAIQYIGQIVINLGIKIGAVYMIIAAADFIYQKRKFKKDMMMTKQEVKEEYKNSEGNPENKRRQRSKMMEASQRRMMQSVPQADVVITNPTHFAVAIKYDAEKYQAPIVLAKGEDYLAQKIKEDAKAHNIQIVENKPLARMLYYNVDIGNEIPPELYQAVAEVLAYVYSLKNA